MGRRSESRCAVILTHLRTDLVAEHEQNEEPLEPLSALINPLYEGIRKESA